MRKWPTQVSTVVANVGRELSLLKMAINMANADYLSFFLWNELEPRCQQRAAGSLELMAWSLVVQTQPGYKPHICPLGELHSSSWSPVLHQHNSHYFSNYTCHGDIVVQTDNLSNPNRCCHHDEFWFGDSLAYLNDAFKVTAVPVGCLWDNTAWCAVTATTARCDQPVRRDNRILDLYISYHTWSGKHMRNSAYYWWFSVTLTWSRFNRKVV